MLSLVSTVIVYYLDFSQHAELTSILLTNYFINSTYNVHHPDSYGSGHGTVAVLLPGFAIN